MGVTDPRGPRILAKPIDPPPPVMSTGGRINERWMHDAGVRMEIRGEAFAAGMEAGSASERERIADAVRALDTRDIYDPAGYRIDSAEAMRTAVLAIVEDREP
jgi:hypothetical protein